MVSFGSVVAVLSTALPRSARHLDAIRATFGWPFPFRLLSPSRSVRPSTGHMRPSYDLTCIFEFALVGIVNTLGMPRKDPFAHGMCPAKRLLLPSHALALVLTWTPHDAGAEILVMTRADLLSHGSPADAQQALYGASWDRTRALAADNCGDVRARLWPSTGDLAASA